jgi:hypothetical protein
MKQYTGLTVGKLTLICKRRAGSRGEGSIWLARCDCGNELEVIGNEVARGKKTRCANCSHKLSPQIYTKGLPKGLKRAYSNYIKRYLDRDTLGTLKFLELANKRCSLCGRKPARDVSYVEKPGRSGQWLPICTECRDLKGERTWPEFLEQITRIVANLTK